MLSIYFKRNCGPLLLYTKALSSKTCGETNFKTERWLLNKHLWFIEESILIVDLWFLKEP